MKIKKNKMVWFIFTLIIIIGYIGLMIYQLINKDFDALNLIMFIFLIDSLGNCFEKDDKKDKDETK